MDNNMDELGRLFLGDVRRGQTGGQPLPRRKAPAASRPDISIDLTPEEFAGMCGPQSRGRQQHDARPALRAVIASHLNGRQGQCVRQYARHEAAAGVRVGLIELEGDALHVSCFDASDESGAQAQVMAGRDTRQLAEALREMNWDVGLWILSIPHPRGSEAREILSRVEHWVLLATCDHDGIVGAYRTLKGLRQTHCPQIAVGLLDAPDQRQAQSVFEKLSGVCKQFLDWPIEDCIVIGEHNGAIEHRVLVFDDAPAADGASPADHWQVLSQFIESLHEPAGKPTAQSSNVTPAHAQKHTVADVVLPAMAQVRSQPHDAHPANADTAHKIPGVLSIGSNQSGADATAGADHDAEGQVIELPTLAGPDVLLNTIMKHQEAELLCCSVRPPMCADVRLAVARDRRLTLVAAAKGALANLRAIAQAYRWATENRQLIAMAIPQMSVDAEAQPVLRLFVDHSDLSAQILNPLLQSDHVRVLPYRRLRWGQRVGLLLEAA